MTPEYNAEVVRLMERSKRSGVCITFAGDLWAVEKFNCRLLTHRVICCNRDLLTALQVADVAGWK
jgi:hypothetical protein